MTDLKKVNWQFPPLIELECMTNYFELPVYKDMKEIHRSVCKYHSTSINSL